MILTLDLFVRQRRDWYEAVLRVEPLVEPVEVFVSPRHLDIVELETTQMRLSTCWIRTYTWGQLIRNVTLQTFELGLLLRRCYHTGVGRSGNLPAVLPVPLVLRIGNKQLVNVHHSLLPRWSERLALAPRC